MIPVASPAAGSRPDVTVDDLRCLFCARRHRPAPDDPETDATTALCQITYEGAGAEGRPASGPVCFDCRVQSQPHEIHGRLVTSITPVDALTQALIVEPELHDEVHSLLGDTTGAHEYVGEMEQAELYAVANRLLLRQSRDRSTATAVMRAAQMEAQLVTRIAADTAERIERGMWWRDNALQAIAARLFPHADAKTKSVRLTYGTIGRKDYKPTPELVDDEEALAACRALGPDAEPFLNVTVDVSLDSFKSLLKHVLTSMVQSVTGTAEPGAQPYTIDDAIAFMVASEAAEVSLSWGTLKKAIVQQQIDPPAGVRMTDPRTEYSAKVTEG